MVRKLYKIEEGKVIAGVCGGIAEYANMDYNIVRLLCVISAFMGWGIIVYIVAAIILPTKSQCE